MSAKAIDELIEEPEDELRDAGPGDRDLENASLTTDVDAYLDREAENGTAPRIIIEEWEEFRDHPEAQVDVPEEDQARLDEELADHGWDNLDPRK